MSIYPSNCTITASRLSREDRSEVPTSTITAKQTAAVIRGMLKEGPGKLAVEWKSDVKASPNNGQLFIEVTAGGYHLGFLIFKDTIANCFVCVTPKRSLYHVDHPSTEGEDGVCNHLTEDEQHLLSQLILKGRANIKAGDVIPNTDNKIGLRCIWQIVCYQGTNDERPIGRLYDQGVTREGLTFPKEIEGPHTFFTSEKEAMKAMNKLMEYRESINKHGLRGAKK